MYFGWATTAVAAGAIGRGATVVVGVVVVVPEATDVVVVVDVDVVVVVVVDVVVVVGMLVVVVVVVGAGITVNSTDPKVLEPFGPSQSPATVYEPGSAPAGMVNTIVHWRPAGTVVDPETIGVVDGSVHPWYTATSTVHPSSQYWVTVIVSPAGTVVGVTFSSVAPAPACDDSPTAPTIESVTTDTTTPTRRNKTLCMTRSKMSVGSVRLRSGSQRYGTRPSTSSMRYTSDDPPV